MREWRVMGKIVVNGVEKEVLGRITTRYVWYKIDEEMKMKISIPAEIPDNEKLRLWNIGLGEFEKFIGRGIH